MYTMDRRLQLQNLLKQVKGPEPEDELPVYFQPKENVTMEYPCIVYQRDSADTLFAGNNPYRFTQRYQVTYIDLKPNSGVVEKLAGLPMCTYSRFFVADGLNHDVFTIFF